MLRLESLQDEGGSTGCRSAEALRLLVVDNDMDSADSLELMLHASGYAQTRVAYTGHAALAMATQFHPNVVLLDLGLLDMGSYELGQLLRERAQLQHVRLIAVTESRQHAGRDLARNAGFERYLLKPIDAADLTTLLTTPA